MKSTQQAVRVPVFDRSSGVPSLWKSQTEELNRSYPSEFWSEASWFGAIAQQSSDLIGVVSLDGKWKCLNPSGKKFLGEMPAFELDEARQQLWNNTILPELRETGEWRGTFAFLRSSELIWFESQWFLIRDRISNQLLGFATISRKIESSQTDAALERERECHQQKTRFFADTVHELKTPLAVISTSIDLLQVKRDRESEYERKHFQRIQSKVKQMSQMLEDVLLLSRTEQDELAANSTEVDPVRFCAELVEEAQASTSRHQLGFSAEASVQVARIDASVFQPIVANLLFNSIKYSPQGGMIRCHLRIEVDRLTLQVTDQGIGIPSSEQPYLFQSFYRAKNARAIPGTGLGLAIVKRCVDLLSGQITVESTVGAGTCFTVQIPIGQSN